jgi:hypothetical protein
MHKLASNAYREATADVRGKRTVSTSKKGECERERGRCHSLSRHDDGTSIVTKKVLEEKGEGRAGKRRRNELHVPDK